MKRDTTLSPERTILFSQADKLLSAFVDRYRYSALGALVKGIIHNLNGALQVLSMQMELLQKVVTKEGEEITSPAQAKMEKCFEQMEKMKGMLDLLLERAAHEDHDDHQTIRLNDLLEEELGLLHHHLVFKHTVKVQKDFSPTLPLMKGYYIDFREGLLSLIQNAIEAMEASPRKELTVVTEERDHEVKILVKDTGCGISEEVKRNLFRPFFTTKGGKNYGLGLFISRELLTPYGAVFDFTSRKGETTFSVNFPLKSGHSGSFKKRFK